MASAFARLEAPTGLLTETSVGRFADRVKVADVAYELLRERYVSATAALGDWDSGSIEEFEDSYGWFTITQTCELGGEFSLTGEFNGQLVEATLWGEVRGCGYTSAAGPVWADAEFLVNVAEARTLEQLASSYTELAVSGTLSTGAVTEPVQVVYAARFASASEFRAALRASGGDVHYERTEPGPSVFVEDTEDFWSCDLTGRRCDSDPFKSLFW